jgi:hypothetical protein
VYGRFSWITHGVRPCLLFTSSFRYLLSSVANHFGTTPELYRTLSNPAIDGTRQGFRRVNGASTDERHASRAFEGIRPEPPRQREQSLPPRRIRIARLPKPGQTRNSNFRPFHSQPSHNYFATINFARYINVVTCPCLSLDGLNESVGTNVAWTRVRRLPADSPIGSAESGSLSLRTGRSPPDALHLYSRKRSDLRIQAGNARLEGTCTPLFNRLHRRTSPVAPRQESRSATQ